MSAIRDVPITEQWLKEIGFKYDLHEHGKHWLLWLGSAMGKHVSYEDFGLELATTSGDEGEWHCWARGDSAGKYHRFIHIRYVRNQDELIRLIEGLTGFEWNPAYVLYGSYHRPETAGRIRIEDERFDQRLRKAAPKWSETEKDDDLGRANAGHLEKAHALLVDKRLGDKP